jgi:hypothetical protein
VALAAGRTAGEAGGAQGILRKYLAAGSLFAEKKVQKGERPSRTPMRHTSHEVSIALRVAVTRRPLDGFLQTHGRATERASASELFQNRSSNPMRHQLAIAALALVALTACDDDDPTNPPAQGRVRVVHAISDVTATDILMNGATVKTDLAYKSADVYRARNVGDHEIEVREADAATDLITLDHEIEANKDYSIIAYGSEATSKSLALTDNNAAPAANKAKVRVVHVADGEAAFDVYVVEDEADVATATPVATDISSGEASAYVTVDAETYFVVLTEVGEKDEVLSVPNVDLTTGKIRTIVVAEKAGGGGPIEAVKLNDN